MCLAQNPGNMLDVRRAYANVSLSAMLRSWNYIEVETSNSFGTLGADALRAAFSRWAQAVCHDLAEHAHDSDSTDEAFPDAHCALALSRASTLALSPALTLNRLPDHANARCCCPCGCRRRPGRRLLCNLGDRGCLTPIGPGCCTHPRPPPGGEEGLCCRCARVPQPNPQEIEALSRLPGTRVGAGDRCFEPSAWDHTSGAWVAGFVEGTHRASQKQIFHERWVAGFVEVEDASHVAKPPKYARMLLGDGGMPLGWCDKRNFPPRLHRASPNLQDVGASQEQEGKHEAHPLSIKRFEFI